MKVLVVGSGGREHAIVRALTRTAPAAHDAAMRSVDVLCAPGNAGIADDAQCLPSIDADDVGAIVVAARDEGVDLVVVGPEAPLVAGAVDALAAAGIAAFGPSGAAARLEGSKVFAKQVMAAAGVPTAGHVVLHDLEEAQAALADASYPVVLKADGLAAGKGVIVCADATTAGDALDQFFTQQKFGVTDVVLEDFLEGRELSLLAICDGERALPMTPARDYKRIFDGDRGPNTGGMGSFSPVPEVPEQEVARLSAAVHQPVVDELARRGTPFHGVLYAGLMLTTDGPKVLEYNVRFGDPETQAILPRLQSSLAELMLAATQPGGLAGAPMEFAAQAAVTLTLASRGYPEGSSKGDVIRGLDNVPAEIEVTHAGTARDAAGHIVTAGGRVLNVTALGDDVAAARAKAYAVAELINFDGRQMRGDIAAGI